MVDKISFIKKLINKSLTMSLFFLAFPLFAFAACGDINTVGMFNFAIVVLILFTPFFLINMEYIKSSFSDGKMLIMNFAPLIVAPIISYVQVKFFSPEMVLGQQVFFGTLDKTVSLWIIYYTLFLFYGINMFYNEDRPKGGDIIKFSVSTIIAFLAISGFLRIIIDMSGCISK